jgi:hypothetical protein
MLKITKLIFLICISVVSQEAIFKVQGIMVMMMMDSAGD